MAVTENGPKPWFIDAWAVWDGRVFASRRNAEERNAQTTVFLAVPDLEPVPVGRISTALRATRSGFQEGLRGDDENEIEFATLAQVRELTRRAYLATGLGPGAPGLPVGVEPGPEPGAGSLYFERWMDELGAGSTWFDPLGGPLVAQLLGLRFGPVGELLARFAEASILEWDARLHEPGSGRAFMAWIGALYCSGALDEASFGLWPDHLIQFAIDNQAHGVGHFLHSSRLDGWSDLRARLTAKVGYVGVSTGSLLAQAPLPRLGSSWRSFSRATSPATPS